MKGLPGDRGRIGPHSYDDIVAHDRSRCSQNPNAGSTPLDTDHRCAELGRCTVPHSILTDGRGEPLRVTMGIIWKQNSTDDVCLERRFQDSNFFPAHWNCLDAIGALAGRDFDCIVESRLILIDIK